MATEIYMPKNGMDMTEGTLIKWLKEIGDPVEKDEPIMEIETDKITMESEAPASGILLAKLYEDGATVPVLTTLGYIGEAGEAVPEKEKDSQADSSAAPSPAVPKAEAKPAPAAPKAAPAPAASKDGAAHYDVAVIGGGPAGYVAAIQAAQLGAKAVVFEKSVLGGTCLNRGCIPAKTYLNGAKYIHHIQQADVYGIQNDKSFTVDMPKAVAHKNQVVKQLTGGVAGLLRSHKIDVVYGSASLASETEIVCGGKTYSADKILLCGGSKAVRIPIPGIESPNVLTSDEILDLEKLPKKMIVIGGGVIGCEMGTVFASYGCELTIIEAMDRVLPMMDADVSAEITKSLKSLGIKILTSCSVDKIEDVAGGSVVTYNGTEKEEAEIILLSIGRAADLECLGALADQIKMERGKVVVDDYMQTSIPNIYAAGDINGRNMLAHAAFKMGETAAANALGAHEACRLDQVPSAVYTLPECACVGLTEEAAIQKYGKNNILVGRFPFAANGRALACNETAGFVKVIADKRYKEMLGVHMVGADAAEMISEASSLMACEIPVDETAEIIHAHPTCSEAFMEACADALGVCKHLPKK
ncbi:MAG: dihydrolipoyl dehydrogenase [Eubacterium sp.]|nr:dihydrolipoyl dehydrogenase [Eubacterium sp.]